MLSRRDQDTRIEKRRRPKGQHDIDESTKILEQVVEDRSKTI